MFRIQVLQFCFCLLIAGFLQAADTSGELFDILRLVEEKSYSQAITAYQNYSQKIPVQMRGSVEFEIATLQAALGKKTDAFATMDRAIQSGFDDCLAVEQYSEWNALRSDPHFVSLHSKMRISDADLKELAWLKSETENVNHDTKMMITENMNRMDTNPTTIPQSVIPVRQTSSSAVLFNRELLKTMHAVQRYFVTESDNARIEHVGTMGVISGTSTEELLKSARNADQIAEERKRAVQQRAFTLPSSVDQTPHACADQRHP